MSTLNATIASVKHHTQTLESHFEKLTHKFALSASSAATAQLCGIKAWMEQYKIAPESEVIVSGLVAQSIALTLMQAGLVLKFADVDLDTLQTTVKNIQACKTDKTVAVFITHYGGYPAPVDDIWAWCKARRYFMMDDASLCLPTVYKTWASGSWASDMTLFNFNGSLLFEGIEGAVITLNDDRLAKAARNYRIADIWGTDVKGYAGKLEESKAALAVERFKTMTHAYERRCLLREQYTRAFEPLDDLILPWDDGKQLKQSASHYFIRVPMTRDPILTLLQKKGLPIPRPTVPIYKRGLFNGGFPPLLNVEEYTSSQITLPISHTLSVPSILPIIDAIKRIV